jgi:PAS domain S-box-containing protein
MSVVWLAGGILALVLLLILQQRRKVELRRSRRDLLGVGDSRDFAQELIEAIPCPVFYKGLDGRYLGCNKAFVEYLGRRRDEIVGHTTYDVAPKGLADRYAAADAALFAQTGTQIYEVKVQWADGSLRDVVMHKATFARADGTVCGLIGVITDITDRKRAEEQVHRLKDELEQRVAQRTAQLEATNKELEEFSYSMSHDMRAPLRALDGFSKMLLERHSAGLDDEGKRLLKVLRSSARQQGRLVDDILHFLALGRRKVKCGAIDMARLASDIVAELQEAAPERQMRLEIGELPPAWGDSGMIRIALQNLLSNAVKYSKSDSKVIIELGGVSQEEENAYSVTDHGVGFDMRYAHKLFRIFERVHPMGQYEGSGIGLAIVKRVVERHGGRVWAEGRVGEGASFHFTLPQRKS